MPSARSDSFHSPSLTTGFQLSVLMRVSSSKNSTASTNGMKPYQ